MSDRLRAVLSPPRLELFLQRFDLESDELEARFDGYEKLVILSRDRAFLFPRRGEDVEAAEREHAVLATLVLEVVPRPLARHHDPELWPHPFFVVSRMPGTSWPALLPSLDVAQAVTVFEQLGRVVARWHRLSPVLPPTTHVHELGAWVTRALDRTTLEGAITEAARALEPLTDVDTAHWRGVLEPLCGLEDVLVHGDVCGGQLLVDPDTLRLTGVLDWGRASYGNPLKDFDFGEWSVDFYRLEPQFAVLREAMWEAYRSERGVRLPDWRSVHLLFSIGEAVWFARFPATPWERRRRRLAIENLVAATRVPPVTRVAVAAAGAPRLTDGVVTLRAWTLEDAEDLARAHADPELRRWIDVPQGLESARAEIQRWTNGWFAFDRGRGDATFAVTDAHAGLVLGGVDLERNSRVPGRWEAGWWLVPEARGRGVASRAVRLVVRWAVDDLRAIRVDATVDARNVTSLHVADSVFEREGVMRRFARRRVSGEVWDLMWFAYLPPDPPPADAYERVRALAAPLGARDVRPLSYHGEYETWDVDDRWVLRSARDDAGLAAKLERECALLPRLDLPVRVPSPWMLAPGVAVHQKVHGRSGEDVRPLTAACMHLGEVLAALHATPLEAGRAAGLREWPAQPMRPWLDSIPALASAIECGAPDLATPGMRAFLDGTAPVPQERPLDPVISHADLKAEHLLVSDDGSELLAVIDWADAVIADRTRDLSGLVMSLGAARAAPAMSAYGAGADLFERALFVARCRVAFGLGRRLTGRNDWPLRLARRMVRRVFPE